jgi:DNA adenine methylase
VSSDRCARPRRLIYFTPLRYPGGKGKLAAYVKRLMRTNRLLDGVYVEPYAGGAAIALELLFHEYVTRVHINDVSTPVYAFWYSVLEHTDRLCRLVRDTPRNVDSWAIQKRVLATPENHDLLAIGFATFFLNRTNRSGILKHAGIIGGREQTGNWKIDARYNADELICRIEAIANMRSRIHLTQLDALKFLRKGIKKWPERTLIYLDPPYYLKGHELYYDFYRHLDHQKIAEFVKGKILNQRWIISYDDVPQVRNLYAGFRQRTYSVGYSARKARQGAEVMFFCDGLEIPPLVGPIAPTQPNQVLLL